MIDVASRLVVFPIGFGVDGIDAGVPDVHELIFPEDGQREYVEDGVRDRDETPRWRSTEPVVGMMLR